MFDEVLNIIGPRIQKSDTNFRPDVGQKEHSGSVGKAQRLTMAKNAQLPRKRVGRSEVVARAYRA